MDGTGLTTHSLDPEFDMQTNVIHDAIAMCTLMGEEDCGGVFRRDDRALEFRRDVSNLHSLPDDPEERAAYPVTGSDTPVADRYAMLGRGPSRFGAIWTRKANAPSFYSTYCDVDYLRRTQYFTRNMNEEWHANNTT